MSTDSVDLGEVEIPDATTQPAAYVKALVEVLGDRDPLEVLAGTPSEVDRIIASADAQALTSADAGAWSFRDVLGHLLDVDIVYGFRFRLALTEDVPSYPGYNEKGFAGLPKLDVLPLAQAFRGLRSANLELLRSLDGRQLSRQAMHGEQGLENVGLMLVKLAGHDLAHLAQMKRAVAAAGSGSSASGDAASALLRRAEVAFAAQDLDAICSLFTDDVVARYAGEPTLNGKQQLREHLRLRLGRQKGYRPRKALAVATADVIVDTWEGAWVDADTGARMMGRGMEQLRLRDGLVAELDAVFHSWAAGDASATKVDHA